MVGRIFRSPFLNKGHTEAFLQSAGTVFCCKEAENNNAKQGETS